MECSGKRIVSFFFLFYLREKRYHCYCRYFTFKWIYLVDLCTMIYLFSVYWIKSSITIALYIYIQFTDRIQEIERIVLFTRIEYMELVICIINIIIIENLTDRIYTLILNLYILKQFLRKQSLFVCEFACVCTFSMCLAYEFISLICFAFIIICIYLYRIFHFNQFAPTHFLFLIVR